jgi:flagellar basal-body rod protein FlgC
MINLISGINTSSAALNAERIRMEVIGENIANANVTRGLDGKPYQRKQVVFENVLQQQTARDLGAQPTEVRVSQIQRDQRPPRIIHAPGHVDADSQGNVAVPNIDIHEEMADLITASRAFEANLAVVRNARAMAQQTLSISKH